MLIYITSICAIRPRFHMRKWDGADSSSWGSRVIAARQICSVFVADLLLLEWTCQFPPWRLTISRRRSRRWRGCRMETRRPRQWTVNHENFPASHRMGLTRRQRMTSLIRDKNNWALHDRLCANLCRLTQEPWLTFSLESVYCEGGWIVGTELVQPSTFSRRNFIFCDASTSVFIFQDNEHERGDTNRLHDNVMNEFHTTSLN